MNLINLSGFQAGITIASDQHGLEHILAVAKATFIGHPDNTWSLAEEQLPLIYADQHNGEPGVSSVRYECDFALRKPFTDVILNGHAYAPDGRQASTVEVAFQVGPIFKQIRVFGDRAWDSLPLMGWYPTPPVPFEKIPLTYERAFGGADQSHSDEPKHAFAIGNLVGTGFHTRLHSGIRGTALPNLEDPNVAIRHPLDKVPVAGCGFLARNWQPRVSYAGTYDEAWRTERYPFLPADFDERYFQGAPADQECAYLRGGEAVRLTNLTGDGLWEFSLPSAEVPITILSRLDHMEVPSQLDTVILEPDCRRCILTWRASAPVPRKLSGVREVWVGQPSYARTRALATGKRYVGRAGLVA